MIIPIEPGNALNFEYVNHANIIEQRRVVFIKLEFGSNEYYPQPQFLLRCYDPTRQGERSFAIANIRNWL